MLLQDLRSLACSTLGCRSAHVQHYDGAAFCDLYCSHAPDEGQHDSAADARQCFCKTLGQDCPLLRATDWAHAGADWPPRCQEISLAQSRAPPLCPLLSDGPYLEPPGTLACIPCGRSNDCTPGFTSRDSTGTSRPHIQSCTRPSSASVPTFMIVCKLCGQWPEMWHTVDPQIRAIGKHQQWEVSMKKEKACLLFWSTSIRRFSSSGSAKKFLFSSKSRSTSVSSTPWLETACVK